MSIVMSSLRN